MKSVGQDASFLFGQFHYPFGTAVKWAKDFAVGRYVATKASATIPSFDESEETEDADQPEFVIPAPPLMPPPRMLGPSFRGSAATQPSSASCYLSDEWTGLALVSSKRHTADSLLLRFALADTEATLQLPVCSALTMGVPVDGEMLPRQYTPVSSAGMKGAFELLVKVYADGVGGQYLASLDPTDITRAPPLVAFRHSARDVNIQFPFTGPPLSGTTMTHDYMISKDERTLGSGNVGTQPRMAWRLPAFAKPSTDPASNGLEAACLHQTIDRPSSVALGCCLGQTIGRVCAGWGRAAEYQHAGWWLGDYADVRSPIVNINE